MDVEFLMVLRVERSGHLLDVAGLPVSGHWGEELCWLHTLVHSGPATVMLCRDEGRVSTAHYRLLSPRRIYLLSAVLSIVVGIKNLILAAELSSVALMTSSAGQPVPGCFLKSLCCSFITGLMSMSGYCTFLLRFPVLHERLSEGLDAGLH